MLQDAILLDIETWPAMTPEMEADIMAEIEAEVKAPANYKDPEKIRAYVEEAKAKAKTKAIEKAALSPLTGAVALVTLAEVRGTDRDVEQFCAPAMSDESACLTDVLSWLSIRDRGHQIVTFNGSRFDLPYLSVRAMARRITSPWPIPRAKDYHRHLDLFDALGGLGSLDRYARAILGRGKGEVTGADVPRLWAGSAADQERVRQYARDEMGLLVDIYRAWRAVSKGEEARNG